VGDIYYGTLSKENIRLSPKTGSKDLAFQYNYLYTPLRSIKLRRIYRLLYVTAVRLWSATDPLAKTSLRKYIVCVCLFVHFMLIVLFSIPPPHPDVQPACRTRQSGGRQRWLVGVEILLSTPYQM
jgi:hypothetical protein